MRLFIYGLVLVPLICVSAEAQEDLASKARDILQERCSSCHGDSNPAADFRVASEAVMRKKTLQNGVSLALVPGDLEASELWKRVSSDDEDFQMPQGEKLSDAELGVLRKWILQDHLSTDSGTNNASEETRPYVSLEDVYRAIDRDLSQLPPDQWRDIRYFSMRHLHNNPELSSQNLSIYRAALSKMINSLHWEQSIVTPVPVDKHATILRVSLVDIGWERAGLWGKLLAEYPYGLTYENGTGALANLARRVYAQTECRIPLVRADWFITMAAVPPLYHELLQLPSGAGADRALERRLNVHFERDFEKNRIMRAGFVKSNVSEHNRVVDRHPSSYGAYWKSYDFASSTGKQNLLEAPLGPRFSKNEFHRFAFQHDGGEIIFNLPNGMQAYMLTNGSGERIDKGPIDVVFDSKQPLGNKRVINGISCIACHSRGMQPFRDDIRQAVGLSGDAGQKLAQLYRTQDEFQRVLKSDSERFLQAQRQATEAFVQDEQTLASREPVGAIAKQFSSELNLATVAAELGIPPAQLRHVPQSQQLGLGVIANGGVLKRETWQRVTSESPYSMYQIVAEHFGLGTPERAL